MPRRPVDQFLKIRVSKRTKVQWHKACKLHAAIRKAKGLPANGGADLLECRMLANHWRCLKLDAEALGLDWREIVAGVPDEPEPFKGPPMSIPRVLD
jgi:hypothetical protein